MKKRILRIAFVTVLSMSCLGMSGCGKVTEEILTKVDEGKETSVSDESYVLQYSDISVKISPLEKYPEVVFEEETNTLYTSTEDATSLVTYQMTEAEEYSDYLETLKATDTVEFSQIDTALGTADVYWRSEDDTTMGILFAFLDNSVFVIHFVDADHNIPDMEETFAAIMDGVNN